MDVHLRDLTYFVAVAEELHFTQAADRLHVSQPVLSRQIAKLERDLRVQLLRRDRRSVALTAAGESLLDDARMLLAQWRTAQRRFSDAAAAEHATLRIGMQTSVGRGIIETLRRRLAQRRPGWTIEVVHVAWDDPTAGLATDQTDVAFCWLPLVSVEQHRHLVVACEQRALAVAADHPLAERSSIVFDEMRDVALVALPPSSGSQRDYWLANEQRDTPASVSATARSADEALEAVTAGLGAVILATGNAEIYARPGLAIVPVEDLAPAELAIVWRTDDHREIIRDVTTAVRGSG